MRIYPSRYKDQEALSIESERIAAQFLPGIGAKMCSLVYKPLDRELLVQAPGETYRLQPYDGIYVDGECSGFDDMFPTVDACHYEEYPWQGIRLPDHGEVWSLAWESAIQRDLLWFSVHGVRFPYHLEKWISFTAEDTLHIRYRLTNPTSFPFRFLWAAHIMLSLEEGCHLALPDGVRSVVCTLGQGGDLGSYGDESPWPIVRLPDGRERDLRLLRPRSTGVLEKYYVKGRMPEGWCTLRYPRSNFALTLSFPVDKVPYLGILPNEGIWRDMYNVFIEPATASYDRIDAAGLHNALSVVQGNAAYEWYLDIAVVPEK